MNEWLLTSAIAAFLTCAIHVFVGSGRIVKPLLEATDIPPVPKNVHYACWHIVSFVLFMVGAALMRAAFTPEAEDVALFALVLIAGSCVWGVSLILWKKQSFRRMPQWSFFLAILIPGFWGLLGV